MGGGGATSGGTYVIFGKRIPKEDLKPNARYDLFPDKNTPLKQSRWTNAEAKPMFNVDYYHAAKPETKFPHGHRWGWVNGKWERGKEHIYPVTGSDIYGAKERSDGE